MSTRSRKLKKLEDWQGWIDEFQNESDRAAVVLGAAVVDTLLEELLRAFFVDDSTAADQLLGVERPLGSFGARGRAAYCLGLVSKEHFDDLRTLGRIRNRFAHDLHGLDFRDTSVRDLCLNLKAIKTILPDREVDARSRYIVSVAHIASWLSLNRLGINEDRRVRRPEPVLAEVVK